MKRKAIRSRARVSIFRAFFWIAVLWLAYTSYAGAAGIGLYSVTPNQGNNGETIEVTISCEGFQPDSHAALWQEQNSFSPCNTPGEAYGVYVSGGYAYVADGGAGLQIIDITDPTNPSLIGSCDTPGDASDVFVVNGHAYVADGGAGLQVINITEPTNPSLVGSLSALNPTSYANGVFVNGHYAYIADWKAGLQVIDITEPANPSLAGYYDTPGEAWDVLVRDNYAYIADGKAGLQIINIADPGHPSLAGSCDTPGDTWGVYGAWSVKVSGNYAYIADGDSGLQVINIADPGHPTLIASWDASRYAWGVSISGNYAYVADDQSGLAVLDISNPALPYLVGSWDTAGSAVGIYVNDSYAYIADQEAGLQIVPKFETLPNLVCLDSNNFSATIPSGLNPGLYDLHLSDPDGHYLVLLKAFTSLAGDEDNDGDGYTALTENDCDDQDPTINPGATELCDNRDNDCDGEVDDKDTLAYQTYYQDADGDGFGSSLVSTENCSLPDGYVINNTDCDDTKANVHPGAQEVSDDQDNDCDGKIDESFELPTVALALNDADAAEPFRGPVNTGRFLVSRTGNTNSSLVVKYLVTGTATAGTDYSALAGSVTIPARSSQTYITLIPLHDLDFEGDETVVVTLGSDAAYLIDASNKQTIIIKDNDLPTVTLAINDADSAEPFTGPVNIGRFLVSRNGTTGSELIIKYQVTGTASSDTDYTALSGSVTIPAQKTEALITLTPLHDLDFEGNETVVVTLSKDTAYSIGSSNKQTITIKDNDLPTVTLELNDADVTEPFRGPANIGRYKFSRSGNNSSDLIVKYLVTGTAGAGTDFTALSGSVTIAARKSEALLTLIPLDDLDFEGDETVVVTLSSDTAYLIGSLNKQTITIKDNDLPTVTLAINDIDAAEPFRGPVNIGRFLVSRTGNNSAELIVKYQVTGTAISDTDYTALSGSVTIPAQKTEALITLTPLHDLDFEGDETVIVTLSTDTAYLVGSIKKQTIVIKDNDLPSVTLLIDDADAEEPFRGPVNTGRFLVSRTGNNSAELIVKYLVTGTAASGTDFIALSGTVIIPARRSEALITLAPLHDLIFEGDETVVVTLSSDAAYLVGSSNKQTIIIKDNDPAPPQE